MKFVIIGDLFSFPEGFAATNRVFAYAKGLIENLAKVNVVCFRNDYGNTNGKFEGIEYFYPFSFDKKPKLFILRRYYKFLKYIYTYKIFSKINEYEKIDAIIVYSECSFTHIFSFFLSRIFSTVLILEQNEHPLKNYQSNFLDKLKGYIKVTLIYKLFDGIMCISDSLIKYFSERKKNSAGLILIPSIVDTTRFEKVIPNPVEFEYIGYFGGINCSKDSTDILVESFYLISQKYPDLHLILTGIIETNEDNIVLNQLIRKYNLCERIHLIKNVSRELVIQYMKNAKVLALMRANDFSTLASFPSKLTEYLATGIPVVSVKISDIPNMLS